MQTTVKIEENVEILHRRNAGPQQRHKLAAKVEAIRIGQSNETGQRIEPYVRGALFEILGNPVLRQSVRYRNNERFQKSNVQVSNVTEIMDHVYELLPAAE